MAKHYLINTLGHIAEKLTSLKNILHAICLLINSKSMIEN